MAQLLSIFQNVVYFYSIFLAIYALLSWFPGAYDSSFGRFLSRICEPYLGLFSRLPLQIGPIDFTIIAAIFVLNMASQGIVIIISLIL